MKLPLLLTALFAAATLGFAADAKRGGGEEGGEQEREFHVSVQLGDRKRARALSARAVG